MCSNDFCVELAQLLAYEQRRNEPLEQKAAERLMAIGEYEKLVQEFIEELKSKNKGEQRESFCIYNNVLLWMGSVLIIVSGIGCRVRP